MPPLTPAQQKLYDWLAAFIQDSGYAPSIRQMMQAMGLRSPAPVQSRLQQLKQKGYIEWDEGKARTLRLSPPARGVWLRGIIQVDGQVEPFTDGPVEVEWQGLQPPVGCHGLRIKGNGLTPVHLIDGDVLLFQDAPALDRMPGGSLVLARVLGYGTTLKSLERDEGLIVLYPVSCRDQRLTVTAKDLEIQGILVGVWRQYPAPI